MYDRGVDEELIISTAKTVFYLLLVKWGDMSIKLKWDSATANKVVFSVRPI
jgi:hypothetical protein